ncbi:MAG TPA: LacI family DNA-binding transcriptional regulator [Phototrophicaceae bacterium]|nr:LacI family DNA-binding transcriptional regulator [Phototrophicaceae bacterium]
MRITMKDVAQRADVSIKTVSRVVNGEGEISEATSRRVQEVIDELGYRPNRMARGLVTQRTNSIGLVVPNINNPFYPEVAEAVMSTARVSQHHMLLCSHENNYQEQQAILDSLVAQGVDGIIIFPALHGVEPLIRFSKSFSPLVVVNHEVDHPGIGVVRADIVKGAARAVEYLVGKGHRQIGMIKAERSPANRRWREQGFKQALAAHQLDFRETALVAGDSAASDIDGGYAAARELLTRHPDITAIFCYNDLMAIGAVRACQDMSRRVPEDCAIVGFDDITMASIVRPALTTIRINKYELGAEAARQLLMLLDDDSREASHVVLEADLIIRESA